MKNIEFIELEQFPKELNLILYFLQEEMNEVTQLDGKEMFIDINWSEFQKLCIHHRVFPVIYKKIKDMNSPYIPSNVVQALRREYQINVFRMLQLSGETEYLSNILSESSIRALFLKGPVLASHLYGDISLRTSSDLDILIPIDDLELTETLLIKHGYLKDDYIQTVLNDWKWRHHHITFFHPLKKCKIEIHWRLNPGPAREASFDELWERKIMSVFSSKSSVFMLGDKDLFSFLVSHGARHGWSRLRWLVDINQLVKKEIDWKSVRKLLGKYQYTHLGGQALNLAHLLLDTKISLEMNPLANTIRSKKLAREALFYIKQMVNLHSEPLPIEISDYHKKHLFSLMSFEQKFLFIISFLFPYPEDAQVLPLPKSLHFLYFPLRPFLWAWRRTKKQVLS
jgi:hypothetical protein